MKFDRQYSSHTVPELTDRELLTPFGFESSPLAQCVHHQAHVLKRSFTRTMVLPQVLSHAGLHPTFHQDLLTDTVARVGEDHVCYCRAPRPYHSCCHPSSHSKWNERLRFSDSHPDLQGRALDLVPETLKSILGDTLNRSQKIYRDMRDKSGQTALHLACKMDRDAAAAVLLALGSDPGARDIDHIPALYHMIINIPSLATQAIEQVGWPSARSGVLFKSRRWQCWCFCLSSSTLAHLNAS